MYKLTENLISPIFALMILGQMAVHADMTHDDNKEKYFKTTEEYRSFQGKLFSFHYQYRLTGEIVDPEGNIVTDVSVSSSKSKGPMTDSSEFERFSIKDGKFDFSSKGVFSWGLTFEKPQYYKQIIGVGVTNAMSSLESGEAILDGRTIVKKVKVVLYPWGNFNKGLIDVEQNRLAYFEEEGIRKIHGVTVPYVTKKDQAHQYTFKDESDLPKNLIYIVPGRDRDGADDGTIRLKTNSPDSGFLPLQYEGDHFFRSMWEAPESGYQPELVLKDGFASYLRETPPAPGQNGFIVMGGEKNHPPDCRTVPYVVFYFRVMGRYGKGLIMPGAHDSKLEKNQASLKIYLYINEKPDVRNTNRWFGTLW